MYNSSYIIIAVFSLLIGQYVVFAPPFRKYFKAVCASITERVIIGVLMGFALWVGGTKAPSTMSYVAQFVTVMRSGVVIDESGVIAKATEQAVVESFIDYAVEINAAASNTVVAARADFDEVAGIVTNTERRVIYISSYLPRAGTGINAVTNHNIAATCEQTRMTDGTNMTAWIWFSEEPAFAPGMGGEIDVGGGPVRIVCHTNFYPETEMINGAPCVRYVFEIPEGSRGVQFIPAYEVKFGSPSAPLVVPTGGITVTTNGVTLLPFTGTDSYFGGRVTVGYKGGIATEVTIDGVPVTNGVHQL